jgi:integrase
MASIRKTATGWRAEIYVKGERDSGSFTTKAQAWGAQRETELRRQKETGVVAGKTLKDAFDRYEKEVSRSKRGHRWESLRMSAMAEFNIDGTKLGDVKLAELTPAVIGRWRDDRLKEVAASTINHDLNLLWHVLSTARQEWGWIAESPTKGVRRPKNPVSRDRRPSDDEIERLCFTLGFDEGLATIKNQCVAVAFLFAIETAMRAGEICGLTTEMVDGRVAHLPASMTKNGTKRDVPLSIRAVELLSFLPKVEKKRHPLFDLTSASLDALFRKAKERCAIEDLTFHDSRHEAITRLAKKLNVLELVRMVGHRDLEMLQIYYNETAAEIAEKLD